MGTSLFTSASLCQSGRPEIQMKNQDRLLEKLKRYGTCERESRTMISTVTDL